MKPGIVLVVTDQETNAQINKLGVGLLELRVDLFRKSGVDHARRQFENRRKLKIPLLLTVRSQKREGAARAMAESKKWEYLQALVPLTDWVDIELSSPLCAKTIALARSRGKKVIVSVHDLNRTPGHLGQILKKALSSRADMVKIAAKANSPEDLMRMIDFTHHHRNYPLVTMCLGPWGALSRLILPAAGSQWVYTFLSKPTAPGQISVKVLQAHLKFYYRKIPYYVNI